jgi:zinc protease
VALRPVKRKGSTAGVAVFESLGGVPILVKRKPGALLTHVGVFVIGGASEEAPELAGLTLLTARTAGRGSLRRNAVRVAEESEMLGGSIGSSVTADSFGWTISVPTTNSIAAIDLLADVVQQPAFDPEILENERAAAISSVVATKDDMYRHPMRLAIDAAFAGHPYGSAATGTERSLEAITKAAIADWHARKVRTGAALIAVVGDGEPEQIAATVAGAFSELKHAAPPSISPAPWPKSTVEIVEPRTRAQSAMALLFPGPSRTDEDRFAMSMIGTIGSGLGGRFFDELREKRSLCYTVHTSLAERWRGGAFIAYIATSPDKEQAARDGLLEEFRKIRESGVSAEELQRAKTYSIGSHQIHMQSGGAVLGEVIDACLFGRLEELDEVEERIRGVSRDDIVRVARRYFDPGVTVQAVVRGSASAVSR